MDLSERLVQAVHGVAIEAFHEVRVGVHRLRDGRVPEQRLDHLRVLAPREQGRRERVPQRMDGEALAGEPRLLEKRLYYR